ncbi:hypothetical protein ZWY2020_055862 [Hordeum vulgare]|nr:hypothetical protein ZWY2020_055862 [Hordeum vulgare]
MLPPQSSPSPHSRLLPVRSASSSHGAWQTSSSPSHARRRRGPSATRRRASSAGRAVSETVGCSAPQIAARTPPAPASWEERRMHGDGRRASFREAALRAAAPDHHEGQLRMAWARRWTRRRGALDAPGSGRPWAG